MKYRKMGKHGMKLSEVSLGAWLTYGGSVEEQAAIDCIHEALESKINFIDVADIYARGQAELVVGKALNEEQYARKDLVISSKVFWPMSDNPNDVGLSRKHIMDSISGSLDRLDLDYLDIYFCHRFDHQTPLAETVTAMDDLVKSGLVRYWGTSVWDAKYLERVMAVCKDLGATPPAVEQPRYNMLDRYIEREVMDTTDYNGMGVVVWSPLAQGLLTGKYNNGIPEDSRAKTNPKFLERELNEQTLAKVRKIGEVAKELDVTTGQLALAWILRRSEITSVITGATKVTHVQENVKAAEITLDADVLARLEEILGNKPETHPVWAPALADR